MRNDGEHPPALIHYLTAECLVVCPSTTALRPIVSAIIVTVTVAAPTRRTTARRLGAVVAVATASKPSTLTATTTLSPAAA
jgi:hypothetical protein